MNLAQISSSIIFITAITIIAGEHVFYSSTPSDFRLPHYVIPVHYHVKLIHLYTETYGSIWGETLKINYEDGSFPFVGTSNITMNILRSTQNIRLHSLHPIVNNDGVTLIRSDGKIYLINEYISEANIIDFSFVDILSPGLYTLKIQFFGRLLKKYAQNFFEYSHRNDEKDIIWLIAPTIQATGVGQLFPCWDEPHLKTTFKISVNHHRNYTVLSNMPMKAHSIIEKGVMWTHFHITPPMSILQFAIVLTTFPHIRINKNITLWCEKCSNQQSVNFDFAKNLIENITLHLKSQFWTIKIPKMDHVAIPNFPYQVTSKWGLIFHRETDLIFDEQADPVIRKMEIARLIAPKIAYQWFSNILSISWWSHFWLHDGLSTLYGEDAIFEIFNSRKMEDLFLVRNQYDSLHLDSHHINMNPAQINSLSKIDSIFSFPRSMKVLILLRMFQNEISSQVFRINVHTYLQRHTFSSISSYEFSPVHEILDTNLPHNISNEFLTWIQYKRYPVVIWKQEAPAQGRLLQSYGDRYGKWWIPVSLYDPPFTSFIKKVWLRPEVPIAAVLNINPHGLMMVNFELGGYFRANYDNETVHRIVQYLNMHKAPMYKTISVINRAKIIDDAFHLIIERQFNVSIFWNLTQHLSREPDYIAWYPMIKVFEYLSTLIPFSVNEVKYIDIKEKFRKLLDEPLETLGFKENPMEDDFTKYLRQEIVKWTCTFQYDKCIQTAYSKLKAHLVNPKKYRLSPGWTHWTYCKGLSIGHTFMWFNLIEKWFNESQPNNYDLLPYLVCSGLNISSSLSFIVQFIQGKRYEIESYNRTYIHIFHSISTKVAAQYHTLMPMLGRLNDMKPKEISILTALGNIINHVYFKEHLTKLSDYVEKMRSLFSLTDLQFSKIQHKIQTRRSEIDSHIHYFEFIGDPNLI